MRPSEAAKASQVPPPTRSPEMVERRPVSAGSHPARLWQKRLAVQARVSDVVILTVAAALGVLGGFGQDASVEVGWVSPMLAAISVLGVTVAMAAFRCWDRTVLGHGAEEFNRLLRAYAASIVVLGLSGLALKVDTVRPWVFFVLPAAGVTTLLARHLLRRRLHHHRRRGRYLVPVLAVGNAVSVRDLVLRTRRAPECGWDIAAACTPTGPGTGVGQPGDEIVGVPVLGDLSAVVRLANEGGYCVVAVSAAAGWTPKRLQQLSWDLEGTGAELVVDPGLMEIAGPRLHVTPVDGLPLLRLTEPRFSGLPRAIKGIADRVGAAFAIILLVPLFAAIVIAVRRDGGPAFFLQTRVGRGGKRFRMIKFRSMVVDAEARRSALAAQNKGAGPLFKVPNDPRVTGVGVILRRHSLDELPQLFNVLMGQMSLIGPRPPLPAEVAGYQREAMRKLLVKPGMTGLWQVSGRSELSWEESVRLDLRYVENWSPMMDIAILGKTVRALVRGHGAY